MENHEQDESAQPPDDELLFQSDLDNVPDGPLSDGSPGGDYEWIRHRRNPLNGQFVNLFAN